MDSTYPATRESRRLTGAIIGIVVVLLIGIPAVIGTTAISQLVIIILAVVGLVLFAAALIPAGRPTELTVLETADRAGSWRASVPAFEIPGLAERFPRVRSRAELPGEISFPGGACRWTPTPQTAGTYGVEPIDLDASWIARARRLRGFRGPVELTLTHPTDGTELTFWLRRARTLQIP